MTGSLSQSLGGGSPNAWANDFLIVAGFPATDPNLRVVYFWELAESGGGGGMWNPLNTTQPWPGATDVNFAHVKNYRTRQDGLAATAHVIHNGLYRAVVAAFDRGDNAQAVVDAIVVSPWGTRRINLGQGPAPAPAPSPPPPSKEDEMPSFPSHNKPPTNFRGAKVDVAAKTITLLGGAVLVPAAHPANPNAWEGAYARTDGVAGFVIYTANDLSEYKYALP